MNNIITILQSLQQEMNHLILLADRCYAGEIEDKVYDMFALLKPLSTKYSDAKKIGMCTLAIGAWVRLVYPYGYSNTKHPDDFISIIRAHGDDLIPYVRQLIRSPFEQLVQLTKQIVLYHGITISKEVNNKMYYHIDMNRNITINKYRAFRIKTGSDHPRSLYVSYYLTGSQGCDGIFLDCASELLRVVDLIPDIKELYEELYMKIRPTKEHNENILKKMEEIVRPYKLARELAK